MAGYSDKLSRSGCERALAAMELAAHEIEKMPGVLECSFDNDHQSGEILFRFRAHPQLQYRLQLQEAPADEEDD